MRIILRSLLLGTACALCILGGLFYFIDVFLDPTMIASGSGERLYAAAGGILGFVLMVGGVVLTGLGIAANQLEEEALWKRIARGCTVAGAVGGIGVFITRQAITFLVTG
jgi:hypothetical protein